MKCIALGVVKIPFFFSCFFFSPDSQIVLSERGACCELIPTVTCELRLRAEQRERHRALPWLDGWLAGWMGERRGEGRRVGSVRSCLLTPELTASLRRVPQTPPHSTALTPDDTLLSSIPSVLSFFPWLLLLYCFFFFLIIIILLLPLLLLLFPLLLLLRCVDVKRCKEA